MSKQQAAASATSRAADLVDEATDALAAFTRGRSNGFGIFADPSSQRAYLAKAVRATRAALALMDETDWPTAQDLGANEIDAERGPVSAPL